MSNVPLAKKYRVKDFGIFGLCLLLSGMGFILVVLDLSFPILSKLLFDLFYKHKHLETLSHIVAVFAIFHSIRFVMRNYYEFVNLYAGQTLGIKLKSKLFEQIESFESKTFLSFSKGDLIVRITDDIDRIVDFLVNRRIDLAQEIFHSLGIVALCTWIQPLATIMLLVSVPPYLLFSRYIFKKELGVVRDRAILKKSETIEFLQTLFKQMQVVRTFNTEREEHQKYVSLVHAQAAFGFQDRILKIIHAVNGQFGFELVQIFFIYFFGKKIIEDQLTAGDLVALLILFSQLKQPLSGLNLQFGRFRTGMASLKRFDELLSSPALKTTPFTKRHLSLVSSPAISQQKNRGEIEVQNLSFAYPSANPDYRFVFKEINLTIPAGSFITIVGDNGAGKSTLIRLLSGLEKNYQGRILVDGKELQTLDPSQLRKIVVSVTGDHGIFPGTFRTNITYGNKHASETQIIQAAKEAALWSEIQKLPQGLDTPLEPNNEPPKSLIQKIAIARALLTDPHILILDEATSDFDVMSDHLLHQAIRKMTQERTVISILQTSPSLRNCDQIVYLKNGKIEELGHFNELIRQKGEFYKYYTLVHGGFPEFKRMLDHEIERSLRHKSVFSIAVFEAEGFQQKTSALSDILITKLKQDILVAWIQLSRTSDTVMEQEPGRYLLLLPELQDKDVPLYLDRMEREISSKIFHIESVIFQFKFSGQIITFDDTRSKPKNTEAAIEQANQLLRQKRAA